MALNLIGIGGMGLMLSPAAKHLKSDEEANIIRMHDRKTKDDRRNECRECWKDHGAELVTDFDSLVGDGDFDGVVVCAGKNGDDLKIFQNLIPLLTKKCTKRPFILHLSTVSCGFVRAAKQAMSLKGIDYVNYPLTGGPAGAQAGSMLILAGGEKEIFDRLRPMLDKIGNPRFFGSKSSAGAEVKLMGQLMVFNGLTGICSAAALKAACFEEPLSGESQAEFFEFLNKGAGGTRQWEVALSKGIKDNTWDQGFMLKHAAVDAIYAAQLCLEQGISSIATGSMLSTALSFAFILHKYGNSPLATHALAREMLKDNSPELDHFIKGKLDYAHLEESLYQTVHALPKEVQDTVLLNVQVDSFLA